MEIEAKFRVEDDNIFQQLQQLTALGPFRLVHAAEPELQHNRYFDTIDQRLRAARYGMRIRDLGQRRIATLKGAAQIRDSVYERDEWEVEIGDDDRPEGWPDSEARDRALALLQGASVIPTVTVRTQRQHIYALRGDERVAELSLDTGAISAGGREEHFRELEIELIDAGTRTDLDAIIQLLSARFPLHHEERSKLARGLALLDGGAQGSRA